MVVHICIYIQLYTHQSCIHSHTKNIFLQAGFEVTTANNGSAGLDTLIEGYKTMEFDFVLIDLQVKVFYCPTPSSASFGPLSPLSGDRGRAVRNSFIR